MKRILTSLALCLAVVTAAFALEITGGCRLGPKVVERPPLLEFPDLYPGGADTLSMWLVNIGDEPAQDDIYVEGECPQLRIIEGEGAYFLFPGDSIRVAVELSFAADGSDCVQDLQCRIHTGAETE